MSTAAPASTWFIHAIPVDNILFASGIIGVVHGTDAQIRNYFDDSKRYEAVTILCAASKRNHHQGNARMFPRLDGARKAMAADRDPDPNRQWINEIGRAAFGRIFSQVKE